MPSIFIYTLATLSAIIILLSLFIWQRLSKQQTHFIRLETRWNDLNQHLVNLNDSRVNDQRVLANLTVQLQQDSAQFRQQLDQHQLNNLKTLQESLQQTLNHNITILNQQVAKLTETTEQKLRDISGNVEKRLNEGFAQTTATFTDVVKRLALIDEAQKKITELSSNVVNLQEILADKRSRGVFGEVQLQTLISNVLPASHYSLQYSFSNGKRVDCALFLPEPTGTLAIDAKFPLENYRRLTDLQLTENERQTAEQQFKKDVRTHIKDVANKYIIEGETAEGAILFIPAESIFAEIHANHYDVVEEAHRLHVWLASPTTMMAILTTARAALKDAATREQVHLIQKYLAALSKDFTRFQTRMVNLARHIEQAHGDVQEVKTSAEKITRRFEKIEQVELAPMVTATTEVITPALIEETVNE